MPDLSFSIEDAHAIPFAAVPMLALQLRIRDAQAGEEIQSVMLQAQVQIEATRRLYETEEQSRLSELFGEPERWSRTLRNMLWTHAAASVHSFSDVTTVDLPVPCTFDFNVAATKYCAGLSQGEIPLCVLFSGTVFYHDSEGSLRIDQIPREKEARFRLPVAAWKRVMDHYYPNSAWLTLRRDVFERLHEFRRQHGIATWEQTVEQLLP